jgi:integrase
MRKASKQQWRRNTRTRRSIIARPARRNTPGHKFGNKFRDWCDQANLPHCSAHGLRKAGATVAANNGATARQLMAIFGWDTIKQAEQYTRKADQRQLAEAAMHLPEKR